MAITKIFDGQTTDGASTEINNLGDKARVKVSGTFGGGTVNLQIKAKDAAFSDTFSNTGDSFTEDASFNIEGNYNSSYVYRLNLTGSTGANIDAYVEDGLI